MDPDGLDSALQRLSVAKSADGNETLNEVVRLTSFAMPRDLTLGGIGLRKEQRSATNKKVYIPNLNVTRNKNSKIRINKGILHEKKPTEKRKCNRRMAGEKGILIQATGLFSDGAGIEYIKKSSKGFNRSSATKASLDGIEISKPSITTNDRKVDDINETESIQEVLEDKFVDDLDKSDELKYIPLKLTEVDNEFYMDRLGTYLKQEVKLNSPSLYVEKFFNVTQSHLFILQLPDYLPCENLLHSNLSTVVEEDGIHIRKTLFTKNTAVELEEGLIGKLQKYKSGKCKLTLGSIRLNLEVGMDSGFLQDVVSIRIKTEERNGDVVTLGPVEAKFMAIPDWEDIFAE